MRLPWCGQRISPWLRTAGAAPSPLRQGMTSAARPRAGELLEEKAALRTDVKQQLSGLSPQLRAQEDAEIQAHVRCAPWFQDSRRVCAYLSCAKLREVCTDDLIADMLQRDVALFVPRVLDSSSNMRMLRVGSRGEAEVETNAMGIAEPRVTLPSGEPREDVMDSCEPLDLILLPGLAFDRHGGRLGRGGGYYDKFLTEYMQLVEKKTWKRPLLAALAYSAQVLETAIPMDASDVAMDVLVTKDGVEHVRGQLHAAR